MPAAGLGGAVARIPLTRVLVGLGFLLIAINIGSAIMHVRIDRERTEQRALRDFSNVTRLLAEQAASSPAIVEGFDRVFRGIDLGSGGFIGLLSESGAVMARVPDPADARNSPFAAGEIVAAVRRDGRYAGWVSTPGAGERALVAASAVRGFPLVILSGATERSVLAPWREESWRVAKRTLLASIAMLALIGLAAWGLVRRERTLQQREKQFRAMIEHSSDGVILTRPGGGGIFYASPGLERVLGYTIADLRGREPHEFIHPDHLEARMSSRAEMMRSPGKVATMETRVRHKDGSWRWIENTISNLLDEPSVGAVVMNFRDITERKHADAERARLEQRLRKAEKMEAVGRRPGGPADRFHNILGGILGYAEMLADGTAPGSPLRRYANNVLAAANRAGGLVEQILTYSRSQRGQHVPADLGRIVAETLELVRGSLPQGIRLEAQLSASPRFVVGDPTQLHQVIMNLCTNAIHATGEGGTLRVVLDPADVDSPRSLTHATLDAGPYARLTIEDTGTGMDEATLGRVFEPFFTTKEVGKGTGLGLSLVYGIVTDSAGAIDVASTPGRGSRFTIYLPRVDSPGAIDESEPLVVRGRGERVLVVDDEDAIVAVTCESLKRLGY